MTRLDGAFHLSWSEIQDLDPETYAKLHSLKLRAIARVNKGRRAGRQ